MSKKLNPRKNMISGCFGSHIKLQKPMTPKTKEKLRKIIATVFDYGMSIEEIPSIKRSETIDQALAAIIKLWEKEGKE